MLGHRMDTLCLCKILHKVQKYLGRPQACSPGNFGNFTVSQVSSEAVLQCNVCHSNIQLTRAYETRNSVDKHSDTAPFDLKTFSTQSVINNDTISADAYLHWWGTASSCQGMCPSVPQPSYVTGQQKVPNHKYKLGHRTSIQLVVITLPQQLNATQPKVSGMQCLQHPNINWYWLMLSQITPKFSQLNFLHMNSNVIPSHISSASPHLTHYSAELPLSVGLIQAM